MRAVVVRKWTEPSALSVEEVPEPALEPGKVRVRVHAAACNFFDTLIVRGKYQVRPPFPFSPGGEVAGTVEAVGAGAAGFAAGDRVFGRVGYGGFAEQVLVSPGQLHAVPEGVSFEQAAAFPIVYGTAHAALTDRGAVRSGETVLVTAAAGGVGLASVQIARALGARVIALASGSKLDATLEAGAHYALDYRREGWREEVLALTDGRGADVVIENVGGEVFDACTRCIAWGGRIVIVGFTSGKIPELRMNRVMLKQIGVVGLHWGPMAEHEPARVAAIYDELFALWKLGALRPKVWKTFPLERVGEALGALSDRESVGKIVLTP